MSHLLRGGAPLYDSAPEGGSASSDQDGASISKQIDTMGFGLYQVHVFILSAGFIVAEGSELQMAAGLTNAISDEFGITTSMGRSMLMTCTFLGFAVGTVVSGPVGDLYGRRMPMLIGYLGVVVTALVTYFAPSAACIYMLRFVLGCFAGIGIPTALITISEVTPTKLRGVSTAALGIAYCLGDLWAASGLWLIMPDLMSGPWRHLLLWAMAPAMALLVFGMLSPVSRHDTPYFLAAQGQQEELVDALRAIATMNRSPHAASAPGQELHSTKKHSDFWRAVPLLLQWPMVLHAGIACLLFFGKDFGYYGMGVFWPLAWAELEDVGALVPAEELFFTAVLGMPGVALAMCMMYKMNRRPAIAIGGAMCAVAAILIYRWDSGDSYGLAGVLIFKLFFPTWQMVTMLLPSELFPTQIRSWGYGLVAVFGRIATIISPTIVETSRVAFLMICSSLGIATVAAAYILPETKDCELVSIVSKVDAVLQKDETYGTMEGREAVKP